MSCEAARAAKELAALSARQGSFPEVNAQHVGNEGLPLQEALATVLAGVRGVRHPPKLPRGSLRLPFLLDERLAVCWERGSGRDGSVAGKGGHSNPLDRPKDAWASWHGTLQGLQSKQLQRAPA